MFQCSLKSLLGFWRDDVVRIRRDDAQIDRPFPVKYLNVTGDETVLTNTWTSVSPHFNITVVV